MKEDGGTVLSPHVRPLPVERGRVVIVPEDIEQIVETDHRRIIGHLDYFGMTGTVGADVVISGVIEFTARITDPRGFHARQAAKRSFDAPKTSSPKSGELCFYRVHTSIIVGLKLRVRNLTQNTSLADRADIADTSATRKRGLLKHTGLAEGEGLWIVPCEGVHSFLNKKRQVTKLRPNMVKNRISLSLRAHSTLELPVGMIAKSRTAVGDQLELEKYDA
jgi:uncharacterized membrane protein (UPF0127 family)